MGTPLMKSSQFKSTKINSTEMQKDIRFLLMNLANIKNLDESISEEDDEDPYVTVNDILSPDAIN